MWRRLEAWLYPEEDADAAKKHRSERFSRLKALKESIRMNCDTFYRKNRFNTNESSAPYPLDDKVDFTMTESLCQRLEKCFSHGLKHTDITFWTVLQRLKPLDSVLETSVDYIDTNTSNVKSSIGRVRAWIRFALNDATILLSAVEALRSVRAKSIRSSYYEDWSVVRSEEAAGVIIGLVSCLAEVKFDLQTNLPTFDHEPVPASALRTARAESTAAAMKSNSQLDSFFSTMEGIVDNASDKADNFLSKAEQLVLDHQMGISPLQHVFNVPLNQLLANPLHCRMALIDQSLGVPKIIEQCFEILRNDASTFNLFRKHVAKDRVDSAKLYVEKHGKIPASCDVHVAAALVLQFLRELPEPLLTESRGAAFVACCQIEEREVRVRNLKLLIMDTPSAHKPLLLELILLMVELTSEPLCKSNGLNVVALSIVLAPTVIRPRRTNSNNLSVAQLQNEEMRMAAIGSGVIESILQYHEEITACLKEQLQLAKENVKRLEESLVEKTKKLQTAVDPENNSRHHEMLESIWNELVDHFRKSQTHSGKEASTKNGVQNRYTSFSLYSDLWALYGFTEAEVLSSFDGGGELYLSNLQYFTSHFRIEALQIMSSRALKSKSDYDLYLLGVRLTNVIAEALSLDSVIIDIVALSTKPYWRILKEDDFFQKVFGFAYLLFEHNWRETKAETQHFDAILNDSKQQLCWLLDRGPASVNELWRVWLDVRRQQFEAVVRSSTDSSALNSTTSAVAGVALFSPIASSVTSNKINHSNNNTSVFDDENSVDKGKAVPSSPIQHNSSSNNSVWSSASSSSSRLLSQSRIFQNPKMTDDLEKQLPTSCQNQNWVLLYSISEHGASLHTLLALVCRQSPTIVMIETQEGECFGGYASCAWHTTQHYYGTGESFVFSYKTGTNNLESFHWSQKNPYFLLCSEESISMGGGGHFAWHLDSDLQSGSTGTCDTFDSPALASKENFDCAELEVWGFRPAMMY